GFLPPVLQCVQAVIGGLGAAALGIIHAEYAAFLVETLLPLIHCQSLLCLKKIKRHPVGAPLSFAPYYTGFFSPPQPPAFLKESLAKNFLRSSASPAPPKV